MKKIVIASVLIAAALGSGCGMGGDSAHETGTPDNGNAAPGVAAPVVDSHCRDDLIPSLWGEGEYSIINLDSTPAGCAFVARTTHSVARLQAGITSEMARRGYRMAGAVSAKGGERFLYEGPDNLAVSALVRTRRTGGDGSYASQVDLHWYDPARIEE